MKRTRVMVNGSDLKRLIGHVTRFPRASDDEEVITLEAKHGKLTAKLAGLVTVSTKVDCKGVFKPFGLSVKALANFVSVIRDHVSVQILKAAKEVTFRAKAQEFSIPCADPVKCPAIKFMQDEKIVVDREMAKRLSYLTGVAFIDASRAELCCVMIAGKKAHAVNQKTSASMEIQVAQETALIPIPLVIAKELKRGDILYSGKKQLVLSSGGALYVTPSLAVAVKKFPVSMMRALAALPKTEVSTLDGSRMAKLIEQCNVCVGSAAKSDIVVEMQIADGRLLLKASNVGALYRGSIPVSAAHDSKVLHAPLADLMRAVPFLEDRVALSVSHHGELFLVVRGGFIAFPAYLAAQRKGKK